MDLSIVIVSYQHLDVLENCLQSLTHFSMGFSYEIIIVDNNTTEGSVEVVVGRYPGTILIRNPENRGFAAANNQGFAAARGEYVLMLNNDTVFFENSLKQVLEFLRAQTDPVIVGCKLLNSDRSMQESTMEYDTVWYSFCENFFLYKAFPASKLFSKYYNNYKRTTEPIAVDSVKGAFLCAPKRVFDALGGLDAGFFFYAEEIDFCYRFKHELGGKIFLLPTVSIVHIGGVSTDSMPWFKFKNQATAKIQFYQKHFHGVTFAGCIMLHFTGIVLRIPLYFFQGIIAFDRTLFIKSFYYVKQLGVYPRNIFS